jgi:hypothetical protein
MKTFIKYIVVIVILLSFFACTNVSNNKASSKTQPNINLLPMFGQSLGFKKSMQHRIADLNFLKEMKESEPN